MITPDVTFQAGKATVSAAIIGPVKRTAASGWQETTRPLMKATPEWTGKPLERLVLPILLDAWDEDGSVQGSLDTLLGLMARPGGQPTPPTVTCRGPRLPVDAAARWVVEAVDIGDDVLFTTSGDLARQDVVVTLMEQPADRPTVLRISSARPRTITLAKAGDTLEKIARRELRSAKKVTVLRKLNPGVKAGKKIPAGQVIVLP